MFIFLDSFVCLICLLSLTSFDVEYDVTLTNCGVMNGVEKKLTNLSCFGSNDESAVKLKFVTLYMWRKPFISSLVVADACIF